MAEFGYHPHELHLKAGAITIEPLSDHAETVAAIAADDGVEKGWIYAPPQSVRIMGQGVKTLPHPSRVFGLSKTHLIKHTTADSSDHLNFHLWALSFFTGMRLTTAETGFLDATPIEANKLTDFSMTNRALERGIDLAEAFWTSNSSQPECAKLWSAAVHALFLGQNPRLLQFEKFLLLYTSFDACFALAKVLHTPTESMTHARRVD